MDKEHDYILQMHQAELQSAPSHIAQMLQIFMRHHTRFALQQLQNIKSACRAEMTMHQNERLSEILNVHKDLKKEKKMFC